MIPENRGRGHGRGGLLPSACYEKLETHELKFWRTPAPEALH